MASKLAYHFQMLPEWAKDIQSAWAKIIDPPARNPFLYIPSERVIGRAYLPDEEANRLILQGARGAEAYLNALLPKYQHAPWVMWWEAPNEPPVATQEQRAALNIFTAHWSELMHNLGKKTLALCLSVGWPDTGQARDLLPAINSCDAWALHEYSAPSMQSGASWFCLRYRRTVQELGGSPRPLFITECGIDGGVIGKPKRGWRSFAAQADYLNQLAWYDQELQQDSYVQCATIFTAGPNADWLDFDLNQELHQALTLYLAQGAPGEPPPPPSCEPQQIREQVWNRWQIPYNPEAALARYARSHNLGAPLTQEFEYGSWVVQGYTLAIVYCPKGHWEQVQHLSW